ncbi:hypothetical protein MJO28_015543 [Puccinia striiformis f. sp. tritici]|uniref:Uncharacterized protein n=1 Tax=Puccinia striiformis f. sp. tritici TaxID=168172 RepID=A0ACC0DQP6_9BASI|nr:hypothetical protein MJO28_015543 [Puccinia striiformis f. sp. tritici]
MPRSSHSSLDTMPFHRVTTLLLLAVTVDHLGILHHYGASAAATPSIEGLVEGESGGVVASRAPLESNVRPSARGGVVLGTESEESERLDIGNRPVVDSSLEHTDGRTINDKPKENHPPDLSKPPPGRSLGDVTGKAKSSPSDRHLHAEMHVPPGASAAQYGPENISYPQTHYMEQPGGSSGHGYERYTQSHQPGGAGQFQNYGPINIPHEGVHLQPFEWRLQPFNYYQLTAVYQPVTQWGYVPVPINSNPNQVATPSASTPYEVTSVLPAGHARRPPENVFNSAQKGTKRLIPSELDQKKDSSRQRNSPYPARQASTERRPQRPMGKGASGISSRQVTPVILKRPSDKSLAKKIDSSIKSISKPDITGQERSLVGSGVEEPAGKIRGDSHLEISPNQPEVTQPAAEPRLSSPVMSGDHSGITSTEKMEISSPRNKAINPVTPSEAPDSHLVMSPDQPKAAQPAAESCSPVMSRDHSGVTSTGKIETRSPRNKAINPVVLSDAPDSHLLLSPDQPKAVQPAAESLLSSPAMSGGITSTGKIETRSPRNKAINPVTPSEAPDSHLLLSPDQPKAVQPAAESRLSSPVMFGDHSGVTSTGKIEISSPCNKAINPVTPSEAPDSHLLMSPDQPEAVQPAAESLLSSPAMPGGIASTGKMEISSPHKKAINPVTPRDVPSEGTTPSSSGAILSWAEASSERDSSSLAGSSKAKGSVSKSGSENEAANDPAASLEEALRRGKAQLLNGSPQDQMRFVESLSSRISEPKNNKKSTQQNVFFSGNAESYIRPRPDKEKWIDHRSSLQDSHTTDTYPKGEPGNSVHNREQDSTAPEDWKDEAQSTQKSEGMGQTRNPSEGHAYVRGAKRLSIPQKKNKFELLSQHLDSDPEEVNDKPNEDVRKLKKSLEIEPEDSRDSLAERLRRSQPGPSTTNDITELSGAEIRAITESASKNFIKRIVNPFILWENKDYSWVHAFKTDKIEVLKSPWNLLRVLFSGATTKGLDFLSRSQTLLRKQPNLDEKSEETKPLLQGLSIQEPESSKKEKNISGARFAALEKNKILRKSSNRIAKPAQEIKVEQRKGKTDISKAHSKTREQVSKPDGPGSSSSQFDISHKTGAYMEPSVEEKTSENGHYLKEMDSGSSKAGMSGETSQFEKKYAAVEPNLSPSDLQDFRLLGHTLRADNKGWDFSIGLELEGMSKRQLDVLKCNNPGLKRRAAWLQKEVGFPEGSRRFEAIQRQIRSMEIAEAWREIVAVDSNQRFKAELIEVDRILRLSEPFSTYFDARAMDFFEIRLLLHKHPKLDKILRRVVGTADVDSRMRNVTTLTSRWNPHSWLRKDDIVSIKLQALNLRLIVLIGDCLQFGRICMTNTCTPGTIRLDHTFDLLRSSWRNRKSLKVPWIDTPERAWLMMDPQRASLYNDRLKTLKGYLAEYHVPKDRLISLVDPNEKKLELPWNPWWNLGHILTWEEQGLDSFMMAKVGIKMRMKKGQKELLPEQNQILENLKNLTDDQREKIISWFHEEFNKIPQNEVQPMQWYSSFIASETLSDINTWYKARSSYLGNHPEGCFQIFLDI